MKNHSSLNKNRRIGIRFHFCVNKGKQKLVLTEERLSISHRKSEDVWALHEPEEP